MKMFLCPKCLKVFACQNGKTLTYCCECKIFANLTFTCPNVKKVDRIILDAWCYQCGQNHLAENN